MNIEGLLFIFLLTLQAFRPALTCSSALHFSSLLLLFQLGSQSMASFSSVQEMHDILQVRQPQGNQRGMSPLAPSRRSL